MLSIAIDNNKFQAVTLALGYVLNTLVTFQLPNVFNNKMCTIIPGNTTLPALPTCVAWQPTSKLSFAVGTETGHLSLLDVRNLAAPSGCSIKCHDRGIHKIAFSPNRLV